MMGSQSMDEVKRGGRRLRWWGSEPAALKVSAMGEVESPDTWSAWFLDAIRKIRSQKQRPSVERICHAIRQHHNYHEEEIGEHLEVAVKRGDVLKIFNKGQSSYKDPGDLQSKPLKVSHLKQPEKLEQTLFQPRILASHPRILKTNCLTDANLNIWSCLFWRLLGRVTLARSLARLCASWARETARRWRTSRGTSGRVTPSTRRPKATLGRPWDCPLSGPSTGASSSRMDDCSASRTGRPIRRKKLMIVPRPTPRSPSVHPRWDSVVAFPPPGLVGLFSFNPILINLILIRI